MNNVKFHKITSRAIYQIKLLQGGGQQKLALMYQIEILQGGGQQKLALMYQIEILQGGGC